MLIQGGFTSPKPYKGAILQNRNKYSLLCMNPQKAPLAQGKRAPNQARKDSARARMRGQTAGRRIAPHPSQETDVVKTPEMKANGPGPRIMRQDPLWVGHLDQSFVFRALRLVLEPKGSEAQKNKCGPGDASRVDPATLKGIFNHRTRLPPATVGAVKILIF